MAEQQRGSCSWETYLRLNSFEEPVFTHPIDYADDAHGRILGELALEDVSENIAPGATAWRTGQIALQSGQSLDVVLTHSPATAGFMYLHRMPMHTHLFDLLDLPMPESAPADLALPGQVILGAPRTKLVGSARPFPPGIWCGALWIWPQATAPMQPPPRPRQQWRHQRRRLQ